jgi:hypothetical protein
MFKNWKTTLSGILAALPFILKIFGIEIDPHMSAGCTGSGLFLHGLFSKDFNNSGTTKL